MRRKQASSPTTQPGQPIDLQRWRAAFLDALETHNHRQCRRLLTQLSDSREPELLHAHHHYSAILLIEQHQYDQAEIMLRNLLTEPLSAEQRPRTLMELAILLDEQGEWHDADRLYAEAAQAYTQVGNTLGLAKVYNNWAISLCFRTEQGVPSIPGQPPTLQRAIDLQTAARTLAAAAGAEGAWEVAKSWHGLGKIYAQQRNFAAAEQAFRIYMDHCTVLDNTHGCGYTLTDLARWVYLPQGLLEAATEAADVAVPILREHGDSLNLAETFWVLGEVARQRGQATAALNYFEDAISTAETIRLRLTAPTAQLRYRATVDVLYAAPVKLHLSQGDAAAAFTAAERGRARVLADLLAGQTPRPHAAKSQKLLAARATLCHTLDALYVAETAGEDNTANAATVTRLEMELADLDQRIELADPNLGGLSSLQPLSAEQVQTRLPAGAALLTWIIGPDDQIWTVVVKRTVITAEPAPAEVTMQRLQTLVGDYLDGPRRGSLIPAPGSGRLGPVRLYVELYQRLIAPVQSAVAEAHTLYIIPAGPLHHIPMGALTPAIDAAPWTADRRVIYAPSATVLLEYCHAHPASPRKGVLVLAPDDKHLRFIQAAAPQIVRTAGGAALTGEQATTTALLRRARYYRVLCFLGHAVFDRRHPMLSRLQLADGSLHATEILRRLRLQTELTILAACETARGEAPRGDEILGISRALLYAGTPSLLATLWRVHEIPTRLLVERLLATLHTQEMTGTRFDPAAALAEAQEWLRTLSYAAALAATANWNPAGEVEQHLVAMWQWVNPGEAPQPSSQLFAHPFFWSPYILIGDRRSKSLTIGD